LTKDPYKVLGVDRNASIEDIKKAYKELVKKYHPDRYQDNPLKNLADEKLAEINEAYEYIMENYGKGQSSSSEDGNYSNSSNSYAGYDPDFQRIRGYINSQNFAVAEQDLNRMGTRNAEWYFLMGVVLINKGNYSDGYGYIQKAADMDPSNQEYKEALYQLNNHYKAANRRYYNVPQGSADSNFCGDCCTTCACLACTDACCECFGSDFISCF